MVNKEKVHLGYSFPFSTLSSCLLYVNSFADSGTYTPLSTRQGVMDSAKRAFVLHLLELRYRTFYFCFSFCVTFFVATLHSTSLIHLVCTPFSSGMGECSLFIFTHVAEGLYATIEVSIMCTFCFCAPLLIYQTYSFLVPSCYQGERKVVNLVVAFVAALFLISFCIAYAIVLPKICTFLRQFQYQGKCLEIKLEARIAPAVRWSCTAFFLTNLFFQIPVLFILLLNWGVVDHSFLQKNRKYAFFSLLLLASFFSPPDVSIQCALATASCLFYELLSWCALLHKRWFAAQ